MPFTNDVSRNPDGTIVNNSGQSAYPGLASTGVTTTSQPGLAGFFGATDNYRTYNAGNVADPYEEENRAAIQNNMKGILTRTNDQIGGLPIQSQGAQSGLTSQYDQDQFRQRQMALGNLLAAQANGQGPSAAQAQLQSARDQNIAQAMAMAASARGVNPMAAQRSAMFQAAQASQDAANQSAQLRANETLAARQQYAGLLDQSRGADLNVAQMAQQNAQFNAGQSQQNQQFNAGLQQETAKANLSAMLQQQQEKDELVQQYLAMGLSYDQANRSAEIQQRQYNAGLAAQQEAAAHGVSIQNGAQANQAIGAGMSALGSVGAAMISHAPAAAAAAAL